MYEILFLTCSIPLIIFVETCQILAHLLCFPEAVENGVLPNDPLAGGKSDGSITALLYLYTWSYKGYLEGVLDTSKGIFGEGKHSIVSVSHNFNLFG